MKRILLLLLMSVVATVGIMAQTTLEGSVTDAETGDPILFGTVALFKNDVLVTGTETDIDGNYFFSDLDPGTYDVEASYIGYTTQKQVDVVVKAGRTNKLDIKLKEGGVLLDAVEIVEYKQPLIQHDNTTSGATVTAENIRSLPTKNINAIAATTAGISSTDGGAISIRGSRSDATVYYIDGVRVSGLIPQSEIDQMQVITGGVEAKYGDLVGGAISLTSKGPSSKFSGGLELETSEYLDGYGYNLVTANVSGPILKNSKDESILGFRIATQYRNVDDNFPVAGGVYRASESLISQLESDPLFTIGSTQFPSLENVTDIGGITKARPNENREDINLTAKIDARFTKNIDMTLTGTYDNATDQFTPSGSEAWALLNWTRNPYNYSNGYRVNARFRHKLGRQGISDEDETEEEKAANISTIRNLYYTLQGSFEKRKGRTEDQIHQDNYFNYGYFGNTPRNWVSNVGVVIDTATYGGDPIFINGVPFGHLGYTQVDGEYIPNNDINPVLASYNTLNGFLESEYTTAWNLYNNVGQIYNSVAKSENDILSINVTSGFDFLPGGSKKGRHSIQFGFLYEQRTNRNWSLAPRDLWTLARISANNHISGVDYNTQVGVDTITFGGVPVEFPIFAAAYTDDSDNKFYRAVREIDGGKENERTIKKNTKGIKKVTTTFKSYRTPN